MKTIEAKLTTITQTHNNALRLDAHKTTIKNRADPAVHPTPDHLIAKMRKKYHGE